MDSGDKVSSCLRWNSCYKEAALLVALLIWLSRRPLIRIEEGTFGEEKNPCEASPAPIEMRAVCFSSSVL